MPPNRGNQKAVIILNFIHLYCYLFIPASFKLPTKQKPENVKYLTATESESSRKNTPVGEGGRLDASHLIPDQMRKLTDRENEVLNSFGFLPQH